MKKILVAIPTAKYIEAATFRSIYNIHLPEGYQVEFRTFVGDQIDQLRNDIVRFFLNTDCDYLFSVDSDIVMPKDTLNKMLHADKDMVTGVYIQRIPGTHTVEVYGATRGGGRTNIPWDMLKGKGVVEVAGCGFGCVLIKRRVLEGLSDPYFVYHNALTAQETVSEDVDFCMKATDSGFTIWCDTTILCEHVGEFTYRVE